MNLKLKVTSKNKKSIKNFLNFFYKKNLINIIFNKFNKKTQIKKFTILKSPHITKTAQEQFEYRLTLNQIELKVFKNLKFLILLKNIQNNLFSDIKIEINSIYHNNNIKKVKKQLFSPDKYKNSNINTTSCKLTRPVKKTKTRQNTQYLGLFDIYGETII